MTEEYQGPELFIFAIGVYADGTTSLLAKIASSDDGPVQAREAILKEARQNPKMVNFLMKQTCTSCWGRGYNILADDSEERPCHWCGGTMMESSSIAASSY